MIPLSSLLEDMPDIQVVMDFNFRPACNKSLYYEKTAGVKFGRGEEVFGEEK